MQTKHVSPIISVCIPVYRTEEYLAQCLHSVLTQDFADFEVIIVSDASDGRDKKGKSAKKIVKESQKKCSKYRKSQKLPKVSVRYIEHKENRGIFEVRRTLASEAKGKYITHCDSDDELEAGALSTLYTAATKSNADIIHGTSISGTFTEDDIFTPSKENRYGTIFYGEISEREIFRKWILEKKITANLWGKLIKREVFLQAYEEIPYTECNLADDALLFFFLSQFSHKYIGIQQKVYRYRINTGMSSGRKITSLKEWKLSCSAASVFTIISSWCEEQTTKNTTYSPTQEELNALKLFACSYLANNLNQLTHCVTPELQKEACDMLCEYWGEDFVEEVEKQIKNS